MKKFCYLLIFISVNVFSQNSIQTDPFDIFWDIKVKEPGNYTYGPFRVSANVKSIPYRNYVFSENDFGITILGWGKNGRMFFEHQTVNPLYKRVISYCVIDLVEDKILFEEYFDIKTIPSGDYINKIAEKYNIENDTGIIGKFPYIEDFSGNVRDINSIYSQFSDDDSMVAKRFETVWLTNDIGGTTNSNLHLFIIDNLEFGSSNRLTKHITSKIIPWNLYGLHLIYAQKSNTDIFVKSPFENRIAIIIPQLIILDDNSIIFGCHLGVGFTLNNFWDEIYPKYKGQ